MKRQNSKWDQVGWNSTWRQRGSLGSDHEGCNSLRTQIWHSDHAGMWKKVDGSSFTKLPHTSQMEMFSQCSARMVNGEGARKTSEPDSSPHPEISLHILKQELITYLMILCLIPYCSSEFLPDQVSYLYEDKKLSRSKTNSSKSVSSWKLLSNLSSFPHIKFLLTTHYRPGTTQRPHGT